jgi:hypothetical protein
MNAIVEPAGTTDASGVATGTIASTVAERKAITITIDPGPGEVVLAQPLTVEFSVDVKLALVGAPGDAVAGLPIPGLAVAVEDASGATDPGAQTSVTIALGANPAGGTLSGTTAVVAVNGVATFSDLSIDKAGAGYTLTVSASGFAGVTSATFSVAAGAATALAFKTEPLASAISMTTLGAVSVVALDQFGNRATAFAGSVRLALGGGPAIAVLYGTTPKAAAGGIAAFSNLAVDKVGTYTLAASASGLAGATSTPFAIAAGPPARLGIDFVGGPLANQLPILSTFSPNPSNPNLPGNPFVLAGAPLPALEVDVLDAGGNPAAGATDPVTIALSTNPTGATLLGTKTLPPTASVATFTDLAVDKEGGEYLFSASSGNLPVATAFNDFLDVASGPRNHVAFAAPLKDVDAGDKLPAVTVRVTDAFGNVDAFALQAVTVAIAIGTNPSGGTLSGTTQLGVPPGVGTVTFSDLSLDNPGAGYTLVATSSGGGGPIPSFTSPPVSSTAFRVRPILVVTSFTGPTRAEVGEQVTLSWTFTATGGSPSAVTLDPGARSEATSSPGSDVATPFAAAPAGVDPRAAFTLDLANDATSPQDRADAAALNGIAGGSVPGLFNNFVAASPDGTTLVTGQSPPLGFRRAPAFLARFDSSLNQVQLTTFGSRLSSGEALAATPDGGAVVAAHTFGQFFLFRFRADASLVWSHLAGDTVPSPLQIAALPDGGVIMAGVVPGGVTLGPTDPNAATMTPGAFIARFAADGMLVWAQQIATSGFVALGVAALPDGGALVTGHFEGSATFGATAFNECCASFLAHYAPDGTVVWATRTSGGASVVSAAVAAFPDGGSVVTGSFQGDPSTTAVFGPGETNETHLPCDASAVDPFVARYGPDGALLWAKRGASPPGSGDFGLGGAALAASPDGSSVVTGTFSGGSLVLGPDDAAPIQLENSGDDTAFIARYRPDGTVAWAQAPSSNTGNSFTVGHGVAVFPDASVVGILAGDNAMTFGSLPLPNPNILAAEYLVRFAPRNYRSLEILPAGLAYAAAAGGPGDDAALAVAAAGDGGALATGSFQGSASFGATPLTAQGTEDFFLARYDSQGTVAWAKQAGASGADVAGRGAAALLDGGAFVVGSYAGGPTFGDSGPVVPPGTLGTGAPVTTALPAFGGDDIFVARYGANGDLLWAQRAGGTSDDRALAVAAFPESELGFGAIVTGFYGADAAFGGDSGPGTTLVSTGAEDIFVAHFSRDGGLAYAVRAGGTAPARGLGVAAFPDGSAVVTGFFGGDVTFGIDGPPQQVLSAGDDVDAFVARFDALGNLVWAIGAGGDPADGIANVAQGLAVAAIVDDAAPGTSVVTGFFDGSATFAAGTTLTASGVEDLFLARYDGSANLVFVASAGGAAATIRGTGVSSFPDGSVAVTGYFSGAVDFGGGIGLATAGADEDAFLAVYAPDGTPLFARQEGGAGNDRGLGVGAFPDGSAAIVGFFGGAGATFGAGEANVTALSSAGGADIFVARVFPPP